MLEMSPIEREVVEPREKPKAADKEINRDPLVHHDRQMLAIRRREETLAKSRRAAEIRGATAHDIHSVIPPHPTLSEVTLEATAAARGEAVHLQGGS